MQGTSQSSAEAIRLLLPLICSLLILVPAQAISAMRVAVFGGSGFIGKRVCRTLVNVGCDVVSISGSGRPVATKWDASDDDNRISWIDRVEWLSVDASLPHEGSIACTPMSSLIGDIDAAVSCIGNVRPAPNWEGFWGLHWDDDILMRENGDVNEHIINTSKQLGAERFVYVSVSYVTAKAFEGPLPGYLGGKRAAESAAYECFGDNALVIGPSLVYGGGRFAAAGKALEAILGSLPIQAYKAGGRALRSLSTSGETEDWVEAAILTPPIDVDIVARTIAAGAVGAIDSASIKPRRQGFFDTEGKPVEMVSVPFIDMSDIRRMAATLATDTILLAAVESKTKTPATETRRENTTQNTSTQESSRAETIPFEGALVGSKPFLCPLPVAVALASAFIWSTNIEYT